MKSYFSQICWWELYIEYNFRLLGLMFQSKALKLQQEKEEKDQLLIQAVQRMENGMPPTDNADAEWEKKVRDSNRREARPREWKESKESNWSSLCHQMESRPLLSLVQTHTCRQIFRFRNLMGISNLLSHWNLERICVILENHSLWR